MLNYYLNWLKSHQFHGIKPGLYRILTLLKRLGNPHLKYPTLHIAGTNGKGSTCAILSTALTNLGYKTGLYTSPHLIYLNERFKINGKDISDETLLFLLKKIYPLVKEPITFFELTTTLAFLLFAEEKVDIAVIETGLGGRLDATNVIKPEVSIITTISFDHTKYLGNTLEKIAFEKAGIIKREKPVVLGDLPSVAKDVIIKRANSLNSPHFILHKDFSIKKSKKGHWDYQGKRILSNLYLSLEGEYQGHNLALALKTLEILEDTKFLTLKEDLIRDALIKVVWEGRFKKIILMDREILLDCAHNPQGVKALKNSLEKDNFYPYLLLLGATNEDGEKPFFTLFQELEPWAKKIFFSEFRSERKIVTLEEWAKALNSKKLLKPVEFFKDPSLALKKALKEKETSKILITGSIYFIGNILEILRDWKDE